MSVGGFVRHLGALWVLVWGLTSSSCCTHNYLDPQGPLYAGGSVVAREATPTLPLRVVTFNIEYALRVERAIELLRRSPLAGADVLALQEMDAPGVESIARELGLHYVYFPASVHPRTRRDFGNALLSPWPLGTPRKLVLPHRSLGYGQARVATRASLRLGDVSLRVYSVHFGAPKGTTEGQRRRQADAVIADAAGAVGPVVVMGDLNSASLGSRFEAAGFLWLTRDVGPTTQGGAFDHIFVRGLGADGTIAGVVREGTAASDHLPVWALLPRR